MKTKKLISLAELTSSWGHGKFGLEFHFVVISSLTCISLWFYFWKATRRPWRSFLNAHPLIPTAAGAGLHQDQQLRTQYSPSAWVAGTRCWSHHLLAASPAYASMGEQLEVEQLRLQPGAPIHNAGVPNAHPSSFLMFSLHCPCWCCFGLALCKTESRGTASVASLEKLDWAAIKTGSSLLSHSSSPCISLLLARRTDPSPCNHTTSSSN